MQKARCQPLSSEDDHRPPTACKLLGFRFYFTPLTGVLFNFPLRYLFTIGHWIVFSLRRWFSQIPIWFHLSDGTWESIKDANFSFVYGTLTLFGPPFQDGLTREIYYPLADSDPRMTLPTTRQGQRSETMTPSPFRLFPFRSPLLGKSRFSLFSWRY